MNKRNRFLRTLAMVAVVIVGLTAAASWRIARTQSPDETPPERRAGRARASLYGLHELTRGQTARLSVVNAGLSGPGDEHLQSVTLAFDIYEESSADGSVRTLRFLRRVSHTLQLRGGEAASLEFEASRAGETIAAWVMLTGSDGGSPEVGSAGADKTIAEPGLTNPPENRGLAVVTSLEVRQGNRTQFVLPIGHRFAVNAF